MEGSQKKESRFELAGVSIVALCIFSLLLFLATLHRPIEHFFEDQMFAHDHTAARAYRYGAKHFESGISGEYDIARAEYFFNQAVLIDPDYPYLQFELARIDFLMGRYANALTHADRAIQKYANEEPNAYYVRGLINGFTGKYEAAAADYEMYFKKAPANWAGINDYVWVLMKMQLPEAALEALNWGLQEWPGNPWLLNNKVTALYDLGRYAEAKVAADEAMRIVVTVTKADWLHSYPGNDPAVAEEGLAGFKRAVAENHARVVSALASSTSGN